MANQIENQDPLTVNVDCGLSDLHSICLFVTLSKKLRMGKKSAVSWLSVVLNTILQSGTKKQAWNTILHSGTKIISYNMIQKSGTKKYPNCKMLNIY